MLVLQSRRNRHRRKWVFRSGVLALVIAGFAAWHFSGPAIGQYRLWKQRRALRQARDFIDKHDAADAQVALEVAFSSAPTIETWRTAADMMDQVGAPQSLRMRERIMQMMGSTLQDRVALINSALRFRDYNAARDALAGMTPAEARQPVALGAALSFAIETEDRAMADALFDRLRKVAPDNDDFKVGQAMLHLSHPDPKVELAARQELRRWTANPKYSLRVRRALLADATRRRDFTEAEKWAAAVVADPQATLGDRLNQANLQLLIDKRPFSEVFAQLAPLASSDPDSAAGFARWILVQGRVAEADRWMDGLPPALRESSAVMVAHAEAAAQLKDWDRLTSMLEAGAWGPVPADTVRLAMSARLVGRHGGPAMQRQVWDEAVQTTSGNLTGLIVLQRLAAIWGWAPESEATLWAIARAFPDQVWVDQSLFNVYKTRRDAANMREVMNLLRTNDPGIPRYQQDWALLSMLTNPTDAWDEPKQIMQRLYRQDPADPFYATGYAFALAQAGKGPQALAVVSKLTESERDYSPRLPYLAYIYGVAHQRTEVERLQGRAVGAAYLPQEDDLFLKARAELDRKPPMKVILPSPARRSTPAS